MIEFDECKLSEYQRKNIIEKTFIKKMTSLYRPHKHLVEQNAIDAFTAEAVEMLNNRLPFAQNQDHFVDMLRNVWRKVVDGHTSTFFFNLADISKAASNVASEHYRTHVAPFQPKAIFNDPRHEVRGSKDDPASQGWTKEKAQAAIDDTRAQIEAGDLPRGIGEILIRIPTKALERLIAKEEQHGQN